MGDSLLGSRVTEAHIQSIEDAEALLARVAARREVRLEILERAQPIPPGSMRVAPGSDAVVWLTAPKHGGEL